MKPAIPRKGGAEKAPKGTANKRSALRSPTQHAATADAARCDGQCTALRQQAGRTAMGRGAQETAPRTGPGLCEEHSLPVCPMQPPSLHCSLHTATEPLGHTPVKGLKKETQQYCSDSRRIEAFISIRWFRTAVLLRFQGQHALLAESDHPDLSYQPAALVEAACFARGINLLPRGCNRIYSARHRR